MPADRSSDVGRPPSPSVELLRAQERGGHGGGSGQAERITAVRRLYALARHVSAGSGSSGARPAAGGGSAEENDTRTPVALVLGAGAGIGQAVATKFAAMGMHAVMVRRGGGPNRLVNDADDARGKLEAVAAGIRASGGAATAVFADATDPEDVARVVAMVESDIGPIRFVNYNIGAQIGNRPLDKTSARAFERAWRMGALGAFSVAKEVAPRMVGRGGGTIVMTSATAAVRGNAGQHAHAAAMAARRSLAQSLAAELNPVGVHVCHVLVDATVNAPETIVPLMRRVDPRFEARFRRQVESGGVVEPAAVADLYWFLHSQPRCAWTQDVDVRPWTTRAWFNS